MMKRGKRAIGFLRDEIVYGGHVVSVGAASIVCTAALVLGIRISWDFILIIYLMIYSAYSYNRLKEFQDDLVTNSCRTEHVKKYIEFLPAMVFCSVVAVLCLAMIFGNWRSTAYLVSMMAGGLLYTGYFKFYTRHIVGFKTVYVSLLWALMVFLLGAYYGYPVDVPMLLFFLFVLLRCIMNATFFDIKDIDSDSASGLKTIPIVLGRKNIFILIHLLNAVSFVPLVYGIWIGLLPSFAAALIILLFYCGYYLELAKKNMTNIQRISYVLADGEFVLWAVTILISEALISYR